MRLKRIGLRCASKDIERYFLAIYRQAYVTASLVDLSDRYFVVISARLVRDLLAHGDQYPAGIAPHIDARYLFVRSGNANSLYSSGRL